MQKGKNVKRIFWTINFPTGKWIAICVDLSIYCITKVIIIGIVNKVMMLLNPVNVIDKAIFPFASIENMFDELPPGEHAMSINPMKNTGSKWNIMPKTAAITGKRIICPLKPTSKDLGFWATEAKDFKLHIRPKSNMRRVRMGKTINIAFID